MDTILFKYQGSENEYLVYDINRYGAKIDAHAVRSVCSRNCGMGSAGIVAGPFIERDGKMKMRVFAPDGREIGMDRESEAVGMRYLEDAGYMKEQSRAQAAAKEVGRVYLSEEFVSQYM